MVRGRIKDVLHFLYHHKPIISPEYAAVLSAARKKKKKRIKIEEEKITNNAEADRIHSFSEEISQLGCENTRSWDMTLPDNGAMEDHKDPHNPLERAGTAHP